MNKALRLLLITGLAAIFCISCTKDLINIPESYQRNDNPFSVERVPIEGGTVTLDKKTNGSIEHLNPESPALTFQAGDSLILTATAKNGYTFLNWVRNGKPISTDPIYQFVLEGKDVSNGQVKYHYEARFGLDYALQVIPSIDTVMPHDLIAAMGPYLHFGDNPPRIDTCFFADSLCLRKFIHNTDDTTTTYYLECPQYFPNTFLFGYYEQHRGILTSTKYERAYGDIAYGLGYYLFEDAENASDIFVMGNGNDFTIYYNQTCHRRMEPDESLSNYISDYSIKRTESVIISGTVSNQGIRNFHMGIRIEEYSEESPRIGQLYYLPAIHDIFLYDYPDDYLRYTTSF